MYSKEVKSCVTQCVSLKPKLPIWLIQRVVRHQTGVSPKQGFIYERRRFINDMREVLDGVR